MEKLEHVARDIFWARQSPNRRAGLSKCEQWKRLTEDARAGYRDIARNLVVLVNAMPPGTMTLVRNMRGRA